MQYKTTENEITKLKFFHFKKVPRFLLFETGRGYLLFCGQNRKESRGWTLVS
jgi:hypothetical protein